MDGNINILLLFKSYMLDILVCLSTLFNFEQNLKFSMLRYIPSVSNFHVNNLCKNLSIKLRDFFFPQRVVMTD